MKTFGKIESRFWISDDIQSLSGDSKLLAVYLLTCEHSDLSGVYRLPMGYITADLGWTHTITSRSLDDLATIGFISRREGSDFICINKFFQYNEPTNQGQLEARIKHLEELPDNLPDLSLLLQSMADKASVYKGSEGIVKRLDTIRERIVSSSSDDRLERKREREIESKRDKPKTYVQSDDCTTPRTGEVPPSAGSTTGTTPRTGEVPPSAGSTTEQPDPVTQKPTEKTDELSADFEQWWTNFPKREGKKGYRQKTFNKYRKLIRQEGFNSDQLLANLMAYRRYCDETGTTGTQYVMTTEPYLNNPDNLKNPWTVNYAARQRSSVKPSALDQFLEANAEHYAPEQATGAGFASHGRAQERERYHPEADCGPVWDHDRPVRSEVDTGARSGGSDGAVAGYSDRPASEPVGAGHSPGETGGERLASLGPGVSPVLSAEARGHGVAGDGESLAGS